MLFSRPSWKTGSLADTAADIKVVRVWHYIRRYGRPQAGHEQEFNERRARQAQQENVSAEHGDSDS